TIIRLKGSINSLTYNNFLDEVKYANRRGGVIIDMEEVEVISSVGIQALKQTSELSYTSGNKIVLLNLSPHVKEALGMIGLLKILPIAANEELAMKMVAKG
ncbi:MAG: STAS domain-containing protein, partial [Leptospiraceae bacterium]|nr:STAS domain-containing protein [Leptospiraceae bacterium]